MKPKSNAINLHEISTNAAAELPLSARIAIFPIGSNEQHGPHLPTGTDTIILHAVVEGVRQRLAAEEPFVFLPSMPIGKSPEHMDFCGTVTFRATTLIAILEDIVSSMQKHGVRKMVFLNSHGGNTALLNGVANELHYTYGVEITCLNLWSREFTSSAEYKQLLPQLSYPDIHASFVETSLLLYLAPDLVGKIPHGILPKASFPRLSTGWVTKDLSDTGVIGDLADCNAEIGEKIYNYMVEKTAAYLREIAG